MVPSVSGVIGSAVAAGELWGILGH